MKSKTQAYLNRFLPYGKISLIGICLLFTNCHNKNDDPKPVNNPKPVANFSFNVMGNGSLPAAVHFIDSSKYADTYKWDFGDGNVSTIQNPDNSYTLAKTYSVKLVVSNNTGKDSISKSVTITLNKPKAFFNYKITNNGTLPCMVSFTDSSQYAYTYKWDFGDGNTSTLQNPNNIFKTAKTYNVKLVVSNTSGKDSTTKQVAIALNKPKAFFNYKITNNGTLPCMVSFTDSSQNAYTYKWDFGDGNTSIIQNPNNTFKTAKTYSVKLVVSNTSGKDSITKQVAITLNKPKASFSILIVDNGNSPTTVNFTNTSVGATSYIWTFADGKQSTAINPVEKYSIPKTYNVKLVAINGSGKDSITQAVSIIINKPKAGFSYIKNNQGALPDNVSFTNTSQRAASYLWDFNDGLTSTAISPNHSYIAGKTYAVKLKVTNAAGSDSLTQTINISPYIQPYISFDSKNYNLYSYEGKYVSILMRTPNLNTTTMFNWVRVMDSCYSYYRSVTGQDPAKYPERTYLNNHTTIADVATTCGAGCGYVGITGIEMQNDFTDRMYTYAQQNMYDQELFYESGRNFWFYGNQLQYKTNDPIVTGYAVFMRFMAMDATKVNPAPFVNIPFATFRSAEESLVDTYVADPSYTWAHTLGLGLGVKNNTGLGGTDLFSSFLMRLRRDYGGAAFVNNIWKQAGLRPAAVTTQDAVDNFILASCAAANKNLTSLFTVTWRWPMSASAKAEAANYPK